MKANPAYIRNEAGRYRCTCACGKQFWCARFNGKYCSEHCRLLALNKARGNRKRKAPSTITNTCEACGKVFVGKRPYLLYITCGAPECRLEIRRRRGKEQTVKAQEQSHKKLNNCLGRNCDRKVAAPLHFCQRCKDLKSKYPTGADWWGGVA